MYRSRLQNDNRNRVNEQDVPESQHTIFIRGLPGHISTTVVKEFFDENIGPCSFDFIKVSQDRLKLFIAVRFERKSSAREALNKYKGSEILGHEVELTYFRDIRRYTTHVQKQGRNYNQRMDQRDFRNIGGNRRFRNERRSRTHSRSVTRSPTRSRSRSRHRSRYGSRSPSRSHSSIRSSVKSEGLKQNNQDQDKIETRDNVSPTPPKKSKKLKREKKKKRKHSPTSTHSLKSDIKSPSDMETSDGELNGTPKVVDNGDVLVVAKNPAQLLAAAKSSSMNSMNGTSVSNGSPRFTMVSPSPPRVQRELSKNSFTVVSGSTPQSNGEKSESDQSKMEPINTQSQLNGIFSAKGTFLPFGGQAVEPKVKEKEECVQREVVKNEPDGAVQKVVNQDKMADDELGGALTNFSIIQNRILRDVKYTRQESSDEEGEQLGNFRLSSLSTQKSTNALREERIKKLSVELKERLDRKKQRLELSYRKDCETFGLMTRKLIGKDRLLEDRLRLALLEVMKDLETEALKQLDSYLDQLMILTST